jgi:hypothetical protein
MTDIFGHSGNDLIFGQGGRDSLHGGDGNDRITVPNLTIELIDGGAGEDVLVFDTAEMVINLDLVQGRLANIETIDIDGSGRIALTIDPDDVIAMTDDDYVLMITGGADDTVSLLAGDWTSGGTQDVDGVLFNVHVAANGATLLVEQEMQTVTS